MLLVSISTRQYIIALEIPAHGTLVLEPNGNHLMVMGLKEHPKEGTQIDS